MYKRLLLLVYIFCFSCKEQDSKQADENGAATNNNAASATGSLSPEAELEILAGCVDNAKASLGETRAFALCKCVLQQVQQKHPGSDSTALVNHLSDTAEVARMAKNCQ